MSRDVSWGLYIAQLTFLVGVAASAVMLVLPYYLHHYQDFGRITILGEFLAVSAVVMCMIFVVVDLGKPETPDEHLPAPHTQLGAVLGRHRPQQLPAVEHLRGLGRIWRPSANRCRRPSGSSRWSTFPCPWPCPSTRSRRFSMPACRAGATGSRPSWPRAFWSRPLPAGPSVLILLAMALRRFAGFDAGERAIQTLAKIVCYAIILHIFFFLLEVFTVFYSQIPSHMTHFIYLYAGLDGKSALVPWMWGALFMGLTAIVILIVPKWRSQNKLLAPACVLVFGCTWIDKGLGMMAGGYIPNPMHEVTEYAPTWVEMAVAVGIYALGGLILTVLYKIVVGVKREVGDMAPGQKAMLH